MKEDVRKINVQPGISQFEKSLETPYCILLDSQYCSMGRMIALKACQQSGYQYYDTVSLMELQSEVDYRKLQQFEEMLTEDVIDAETITKTAEFQLIRATLNSCVEKALNKGKPLLIHDVAYRSFVEEKGYSCLTVYTYGNNLSDKIVRARVSPLFAQMSSDEEIIEGIHKMDNIRYNQRLLQGSDDWGKMEAYDLCINIDTFGRDGSAALLAQIMKGRI